MTCHKNPHTLSGGGPPHTPCPGLAPAPAEDVAGWLRAYGQKESVRVEAITRCVDETGAWIRDTMEAAADAWSRAHLSPPEKGPGRLVALEALYEAMKAKRDASPDPTNELGRAVVGLIAACDRPSGGGGR